jgi:hypothetical protein
MDSKYLLFGGLGLGAVVLIVMLRGSGNSNTTTTASIPSTTSGTNSMGGTMADIPDLTGVDWIAPANTTQTQINQLLAAGFTPQTQSATGESWSGFLN